LRDILCLIPALSCSAKTNRQEANLAQISDTFEVVKSATSKKISLQIFAHIFWMIYFTLVDSCGLHNFDDFSKGSFLNSSSLNFTWHAIQEQLL
jgi:hypothetical protein